MNKILSLLGLVLLTSNLSAAVLSVKPSIGVVVGFSDSSFDYNTQEEALKAKFCYVGSVQDVCQEISEASFNMNSSYRGGAHDSIELVSCEILSSDREYDEDKVAVSYILTDDYGSEFAVKREISKCAKSSFVKNPQF